MPASAVIDASVLVSAFLFPGSVPGRVVKLAGQGRFTMHLSPLPLDETRAALLSARLTDAYGYDKESVSAWCGERHWGRVHGRTAGYWPGLPRPTNDHVIATAVATGAGSIVTGDDGSTASPARSSTCSLVSDASRTRAGSCTRSLSRGRTPRPAPGA